jgi:dihydrofolate reductase
MSVDTISYNKNIEINMIVAHDRNYGIGNEGNIPWYISEDLKYFRNLTQTHIIVMGRKTYYSIPSTRRPLPNRINIILTNNPEKYISNEKVVFCNELQLISYINYFNKTYNNHKVFFIGGTEIYKRYMNIVDNLYITYIDKEYKCDTFFPQYDNSFNLYSTINNTYSESESCYITFKHYKPKIKNE